MLHASKDEDLPSCPVGHVAFLPLLLLLPCCPLCPVAHAMLTLLRGCRCCPVAHVNLVAHVAL